MKSILAFFCLLPWLTMAQVPVMPGGAVPWYRLSKLSPPSTNLILWYKPDGFYSDTTLSTPAADGDKVYGWKDVGFFGVNLTNGSGAANVMYYRSSGGPNGYGYLDTTKPWSATSDTGLRSLSILNCDQPLTAFIVYQRTNFIAEFAFDGNGGPQLSINGGDKTNSHYIFAGSSSVLRFVPPIKNTWNLIAVHFNGGSSWVRTNNALAASGSVYGNGWPSLSVANNWSLSYPALGKFAELMIYTNISSSTESNVEAYLMAKYNLPSTITPTVTTFITGQTLGSLRNNFTGSVGFHTTAAKEFTLTHIGRWVYSGNNQTHTLRVWVTGSGIDSSSTVTVDCNGATSGQFIYAALPVAIEVKNGTDIRVESSETNGGDIWYDGDTTVTHTTACSTLYQSANQGNPGGVDGQTFGPVSFKYYLE